MVPVDEGMNVPKVKDRATAQASDEPTASELEASVVRLELQKHRIEGALTDLKAERLQVLDALNRAKQALAAHLRDAERQKPKQSTAPGVSAHALLRYIERILDVDVDLLRQTILSPENRAAIEAGATRIKANGITLVVKDKVVVTVHD